MIMRSALIKAMTILVMLLFPYLGNAEKLTLENVNALRSNSITGQFRVMVEFKNDGNLVAEGLSTDRRVNARQGVKDAYLRRALKRQTDSENMRGRYVRPNLRTLSVSSAELENLLADDGLTVYQDKLHKPSLASSVSKIFPTQSTSPFSGSGQVVAILDTGVRKSHSFLSGSVIAAAEACFSNTESSQFLESLCPNDQDSMIGSGAGAACDSDIEGCAHGTQIAGVIVGQGASFNGVATSAQIIPVQVFSLSNDEIICSQLFNEPSPCITALESDIISGLDYIDSIKNTYSIAAVNISLASTDLTQGVCGAGDTPAEYLAVIDSLVSSDIAVIAPSGNQGNLNEMASPACIDDVIAVAATDDSDVAWTNNNRNSELDFFAPGESITTSSLPNNNSYSTVEGTSIAAAHVSGAWAVMKSQNPSASVAAIKNTLTNTGISVTQGLFTKPRVSLTFALGEVIPVGPTSFLPAIYLLLLDD